MTTNEALEWAYKSDWGTDWDKDCKAMFQLAEAVTDLRDALGDLMVDHGIPASDRLKKLVHG